MTVCIKVFLTYVNKAFENYLDIKRAVGPANIFLTINNTFPITDLIKNFSKFSYFYN